MAKTYRYSLSKTSKKEICPACGKKSWKPYIDNVTDCPVTDHGRCDRADKCGYHVNPYTSGYSKQQYVKNLVPPAPRTKPGVKVHLPQYCISDRRTSTLEEALCEIFDKERVKEVCDMYYVSQYLEYTVFYYVDIDRNVRAGQCRAYTGLKGGKTTFIHKLASFANISEYEAQEKKVDCWFGEHLLHDIDNYLGICVVEAPKTAIIMACLFPDILWLSAFNLTGLSMEKLIKLNGKGKVCFIPDTAVNDTASAAWAKSLAMCEKIRGMDFTLLSTLDLLAIHEEKESGYDIADYAVLGNEDVIEIIYSQLITELTR